MAFDPEMVAKFFSFINFIGEKKVSVLVQFPPSVQIEQFRQLELLMRSLRENDPECEWDIALEF